MLWSRKKITISRLSKVLCMGVFSTSEMFEFGSVRDGVLCYSADWSDPKWHFLCSCTGRFEYFQIKTILYNTHQFNGPERPLQEQICSFFWRQSSSGQMHKVTYGRQALVISLVLSMRAERLIAVCATGNLLHNIANGIYLKNTAGLTLFNRKRLFCCLLQFILHCFEELSFSMTALHQS